MSHEFFDIAEQYKLLKKRRKIVIFVMAAALCFASIYNIFAERLYLSVATIMPFDSGKNDLLKLITGSGVSQAITGLFGGMTGGSAKDKLINILNSRSLTENVITALDLMPKLFPDKWDGSKNAWNNPSRPPSLQTGTKKMQSDSFSIQDNATGLIAISVLFNEPELSSMIANQYTIELQKYLNHNSLTLGQKNRVFLEEQLEKNRVELANAENDLKAFQENHKIVSMDAQAEMTVRTISNLKAEILNREYQLALLRDTTGFSTTEARKLIDEKRELEKQLKKVEYGDGRKTVDAVGSKITSAKDFPSIETEYLRLKREFLILEKVYELLTSQYEIAKIEEVRDQIAFQTIDRAIPPLSPYSPKVLINTILALFSAFILSFLVISIVEVSKKE